MRMKNRFIRTARSLVVALSLASIGGTVAVVPSFAEPPADVPAWLRAHVGEGEGEVAPVILQRARALYLQKVNEGAVKNPCYFAMAATRQVGWGAGFTSSAKPSGRFARFQRVTATAAI